jgi:hypothetical protein
MYPGKPVYLMLTPLVVTAADLKLGLGSLAIQIGDDANDVIHFEGFDPADVFARRPFEHVEFDDGTTLSYDTLMAVGFDIAGTADDGAARDVAKMKSRRWRDGVIRPSGTTNAANDEYVGRMERRVA